MSLYLSETYIITGKNNSVYFKSTQKYHQGVEILKKEVGF